MKTLAKHGLLAAMFLSLALPGCGDKAGDGKDGKDGKDGGAAIDQSSPEKVAESFKKAAGEKDWNTMFACMTQESHKTMLGGVMIGAGFSTFGDEKKKESFEALMKKHGVDTSKKVGPNDDPMAGIKDKPALFGDLVEFLEKNSPQKKGEKQKSFSETFSSVELKNFKIDGDKATADVVGKDGGEKEEPAEFRKIDGKWYLHFEDKMSRAKGFPKD
jgi:hypothetical protein